MSREEFRSKVEKLQANYYKESQKALFFKKQQKEDCANVVSSNFDIEEILRHTVFNIPNTNKVFFDYTIFKMYANTNNSHFIISRVLQLFQESITKYGNFEAHLNLNTFTISAFERYKPIISYFCDECLRINTNYQVDMIGFYIYNTPSMIDMLSTAARPFMDDVIRKKVVLYSKKESEKLISDLVR
uniref:CRAL-TRIO domain-containing protein n=1 Tax=viral metagenome TaxID=1070528 RepID=A0A6C0D2Z9_9ZZZZ